jgi:DNA processing protein
MNGKYILALNTDLRVGGQTIKKIGVAFDNDFEKMWKVESGRLRGILDVKTADIILEIREKIDPEREVEKINRLNLGYTTIYDKSYPPLLKEIYDAPAILYVKGDPQVLKNQSLAVVGSRKFSNYGVRSTKKLVSEILQVSNLAIISGLALGIDSIAHKTTLENNGTTIGVLACGLDSVYPVSNKNLADEIIKSGGAIISEQAPGTLALKHLFPARNRIIAGLSLGTLVVEAAKESGALITAYEALEYNREVFAVPGNIDSSFSKGTNELIQKGATAVTEAKDILDELNIKVKAAEQVAKEIMPESEEEIVIYKLFGMGEEILADVIVRESGLNIVKVNSCLTMMEMKGILENVGGGRYRKKSH